jgi:mRNA-degrading endonuclease RelE of RelBE toxin-antitoxin system
MTYKLEFLPSAYKEWNKLGHTLREQFKKKLGERLNLPRVPADALHGMPDCYNINAELLSEIFSARIGNLFQNLTEIPLQCDIDS